MAVDLPTVGTVRGTADELSAIARGLQGTRAASTVAVENCRDAIAAGAVPYGAIRVEGAAAGPPLRRRGGYSLPITFRELAGEGSEGPEWPMNPMRPRHVTSAPRPKATEIQNFNSARRSRSSVRARVLAAIASAR